MKSKLVQLGALAVTFFMAASASAQGYLQDPKYGPTEEARKECATNLNLYKDGFKAKDYKEAYKYWRVAYKICPGASLKALQEGRVIYQHFIETAPNEAAKQAYVDSLMALYDTRIKYFPKYAASALEFKVQDLLVYRPNQAPQALEMINTLIKSQGENASAEIIAYGMVITCDLYKKKEATADQVMNYYSTYGSIIEKQLAADPNSEEIKNAKATLDATFVNSGVANCDNLVELYTSKFEQTPNDIEMLKRIVALFSANRCTKSDLYFKAAIALQKLEPSAEGALNVANLFTERGEYMKALPYFKEAAGSKTSAKEKSGIYIYAAGAMMKAGNKSEARSLARLALDADANSGMAYILIANIIGSEKCNAADPVLSAGPYFVAVDYLRKAKQVDPSVADEADRLINSYSAAFPSKTDLFSYAYEVGQTITVGCGINERTTVRSR